MKLDASQMAFVESEADNIRLLAPAGSGKTTTLLYRCRHLLEKAPGEKVILFTFTRVACEELKERLRTNGDFAKIRDRVAVSTLNSYGNKLLRHRYAGFRLLGTDKKSKTFALQNYLRPVADSSPVIAANINSKVWVMRHSRAILELIDTMKSLGFDHEKVALPSGFAEHCVYLVLNGLKGMYIGLMDQLHELGFVSQKLSAQPNRERDVQLLAEAEDNFVKFYVKATEMLCSQNQFTMEDQKYWGWKLTQESGKVSGAARYAHIMVDEFQDINPVDLYFINALRERHQATLTLVGDDDQTIFEWRGATPQYILNPGKHFTNRGSGLEFKTFILSVNYRSPRNVVDVSQRLIAHNLERVAKNVTAASGKNAKIGIVTTTSYDEVVDLVKKDLGDPAIGKIALVTRKRSHLIPYQIILAGQGERFYAAEDLNVMLNEAFGRLKGLLDIKRRLKEMPQQSAMTLTDDVFQLCNAVLKYPFRRTDAEIFRAYMYQGRYDDMKGALLHLAKMGATRIRGFDPANYVVRLGQFATAKTVFETISCIAKEFTGLKKDFRRADDDLFYADPPFNELAAFSQRYGADFGGFCRDVEFAIASLSAVISGDDRELSEEERQAIFTKLYLMTGLRTKGKEFDSVYVLQADADVWPITKAVEEGRVEAERRLFYVAVTRACKKLTFVTNAHGLASPYLTEMGLM